MLEHSRRALIGVCIAAMAGCGGGAQEPAAAPDATAAAAPAPAVSTSAATPALAGVRPLVVPESMVTQVAAPPRPDNGKLVVHPGIRPRDQPDPGTSVPVPGAAGVRGTRTPLSGG